MTQGNGIPIDHAMQGEYGHDAEDPASSSDLYGPQWALCVSTSRALGLEAGIFVRQLGHWLVEVKTGGAIEGDRRWIWRTYQEWAEEFGWWEWWEIRDRVLPAIPEGVVLRKGAWRNGRKTTLYSLDFHHLDRLIRAAGQDPPRWVGLGIDRDRSQPIQTNFDHMVDKESESTSFIPSPDKRSESTSFNESESTSNKESESTSFLTLQRQQQREHPKKQLASSVQPDVSETDQQWDKVDGVDEEDYTFLERVWSLYCDDYDANETIGLDDSRWRPLRDGIVEWQRGHRSLIDPSRAEQIFDSITTRNPREPIGLIFSVFRDEIARREDLAAPYVPQVRQGSTRMAGRY